LVQEVLPDPPGFTIAELTSVIAERYPYHPEIKSRGHESLKQYIAGEIDRENKQRQASRGVIEVLAGKEYNLPWGRYARAGAEARIRHLIEQHNDQVREEVLKRLQQLDWITFQNQVIPKILERYGFSEFILGATGPDEGIDAEARFKWFLMEGKAILQAKRYRDTARIGGVEIDKVLGVAAAKQFDMAILVTTGRFTSPAIKKARLNLSGKIAILIDGRQLVKYMTELGMGIRREKMEFERYQVDETFFSELQQLVE
jgi:restriction endonuclease Mrr